MYKLLGNTKMSGWLYLPFLKVKVLKQGVLLDVDYTVSLVSII